jgi:hypothetical protein
MESRKRRWPSAKRMSKARVDFPEPERPEIFEVVVAGAS